MKNSLLIVNNYLNIFPQRINDQESIDTILIRDVVRHASFLSDIVNFGSLNSTPSLIDSYSHILYCSSQCPRYKSFILDYIIYFQLHGKNLISSLEHFHAHENKVFQTLFLKNKNINYPASRILSTYEESLEYLTQVKFPIVLKNSEGWGSKGVELIKNIREAPNILRNYCNSESHQTQGIGKIILQEYIPNLKFDWKILIFGNLCAGLYREVRENDFRASGSGKFKFEAIPRKILDYAFYVKKELNLPWVSLDIASDREKLYLIEYQAIHFGLLTALKCNYHYKRIEEGYEEISGPINVDREMANQILNILKT